MLRKLSFLILFFIGTTPLWAQDYIITLQKDTLYGEVELLLPEKFSEDLSFTHDGNKERIKAYKMLGASIDSEIYHPVKLNDKYRIMKLIKGGYLSLYQYRADEAYEFNAQYLVKRSKEGLEVPNISFKKKVVQFLSDCPNVTAGLEDKTYKRNDLEDIVDVYNQCLEQKTEQRFVKDTREKVVPPPVTISEEDVSKVSLIDRISGKLNNAEHSELKVLLTDIKNKIEKGQAVPGYLTSALKEQTAGITTIEEDVKKLLEEIK